MRVAVIGAGVSGLVAIKCCLEENLSVVCFEQGETFGGLWEHKSKPLPNETTVSKQVVCNTSKEMMAFSDFPPPQDFPLYMPHKKYREYLHLYVKQFHLEPLIRFNTKVHKCDYKENTWWLKVEDLKTNSIHEEIFDAVMVCSGNFQKPKWPSYPGGISTFSGQILHVQQYRQSSDYSGKKVLVIGLGNSAAETAVELTRDAEQVYSSTTNGKWICKRLTPAGLPADVHIVQRVKGLLLKYLPSRLSPILLGNVFCLNHKYFGLNQKSPVSAQTLIMNDDVVDKIASGKLIIKPNVERFTANEVHFVDGTVLTDIDVVIFGTGYEVDYPCLEESTLKIEGGKLFAYKHMFPPELMDKNLAIIGCMSIFGPAGPVHETQCRLATRVFKGLVELPPKEDVLEEIKATLATQLSVDSVDYQDQLCELIGCKPNIWDLLLSDPYVALQVFVGPCTPYQFRLSGPGKWEGAKCAILNQWKRMYYPTNTHVNRSEEQQQPPWIKDFIFGCIAFLLILLILPFAIFLPMF